MTNSPDIASAVMKRLERKKVTGNITTNIERQKLDPPGFIRKYTVWVNSNKLWINH